MRFKYFQAWWISKKFARLCETERPQKLIETFKRFMKFDEVFFYELEAAFERFMKAAGNSKIYQRFLKSDRKIFKRLQQAFKTSWKICEAFWGFLKLSKNPCKGFFSKFFTNLLKGFRVFVSTSLKCSESIENFAKSLQFVETLGKFFKAYRTLL